MQTERFRDSDTAEMKARRRKLMNELATWREEVYLPVMAGQGDTNTTVGHKVHLRGWSTSAASLVSAPPAAES